MIFFAFIEYQLFGLNAYAYFVAAVMQQATITTLFFYYLSTIGSSLLAFICALSFAFHPTLEWGFGKVDLQQHYQALLFIMLSLIFLKKTMISGRMRYRVLTLCCYFIAIASREVWLVFPVIAWGTLSMFPSLFIQKQPSVAERRNIILQLCSIASFYLLLKAFMHPPLLSSTLSSLPITTSSLFETLRHSCTSLYELFLLYWYPCSTFYFFADHHILWLFRMIKFILVTGTGYLFIKSNQKQTILYLILCIALLFWPVFAMPHFSHRYMYETLPFFYLILFLLLNQQPLNKIATLTKMVLCTLLTGFVIVNAQYVISIVREDCNTRMFTDNIITDLRHTTKHLPQTQGAAFLQGCASKIIYTGFMQAVKLNHITSASTLCFIRDIAIRPKNAPVEALLIINHHDNQLQLQSRDSSKLWFSIATDTDAGIPPSLFINKIIIHQKDIFDHIFDLSLIFADGLLPNNIVIFVWEEGQQKFIPLTHVTTEPVMV
jgi:hypothetical protein